MRSYFLTRNNNHSTQDLPFGFIYNTELIKFVFKNFKNYNHEALLQIFTPLLIFYIQSHSLGIAFESHL